MNKSMLLLILGLSASTAFAQAPATQPQSSRQLAMATQADAKGNAKISGAVLDAQSRQPVEFATIALINQATGKPIDGTMADEKGRFALSKVAVGKYNLQVSFIGYQQQVVKDIVVASDNADVQVGTISLASDTRRLDEVVITGEKPLVEEKIDRTVYNAEKDITNAGGTAADVLQKVPALSLDNDGNVQLRGSSNVRVLINNKPSAIMAGSIADALKQIPADQIKSVEVITSPSAKYDAEGTAGIINIITKKDGGLQGVTGSVALSAGTRATNGNASLNVRRGKLGINGNFGSHLFYNKGDMTNETIYFDNPATVFDPTEPDRPFDETAYSFQSGNTRINGAFMNAQLGFEYDITPKNSLSGGFRTSGGTFKMKNDQAALDRNVVKEISFLNNIRNHNERIGKDFNLDFTHTFKKPGQELALLSLYSVTDAENIISQDYFNTGEAPYKLVRNNNNSLNKELTFQADYTHPFANKTTLEIGAKNILRDVESMATYSQTPASETPRPTDNLFYEQDVYATYLTYGFALKKLNVKVGGRYEYTDVAADLDGEAQDFSTSYDNFIPSIAFSYTLKDKHTFKANFTNRIQRPSMFYLNPYRQEQTSNTFVEGNPKLNAELTNLYELGYSTYFKTTSLSATLYMRQTDNAIETVASGITTDDGRPATLLSFRNIAKNKTYGVTLFGNTKPTNAWTIGGSSNIYFVDLNSSFASNNGWMYNINLNSGYDVGKGLSAQFNGGFNSQRIQLLGRSAAFSYHSIAIKKELFNKKGGIGIGMDNPFRKSMKMANDVETTVHPTNPVAYEQHVRINNYNRGFKLTFDYRFGKLDQPRPPKRKKSIRNDDTKQGDGNGVG